MTLPASVAISLSQVNVELGRASNAAISLNDSAVRSLLGVASGGVSLSNGFGKSAINFAFSQSGLGGFVIRLKPNGEIVCDGGFGGSATYYWAQPVGSYEGLYEVQIQNTGLSDISCTGFILYGGVVSAWVTLSAEFYFGPISPFSLVYGNVTIRRKSDGATISTSFTSS